MKNITFEVGDRVRPRSGGYEGTIVAHHPDPERDLLLVESVIFHSAHTVRLMWRSCDGSVGEQRYHWYYPSELIPGWLFSHEEPNWWMVPRSLRDNPEIREFSKEAPDIPWDELLRCNEFESPWPTMWDVY